MTDDQLPAEGLTPLENLRVWLQDLIDSKLIIICSPEWESLVKCLIAASPVPGLWDVQVMPGMPDNVLYVLDPNAAEALVRQTFQTMKMPPLYEPDVPLSRRYLAGDWPTNPPGPVDFYRGPIA